MMLVRLFCPKCVTEVTKDFKGFAEIGVPLPVEKINETGNYDVTCLKGHKSLVILSNIKFELLFELGLNALIDSYPKEAVSSFMSSLERFYDFYWLVVMKHFSISEEITISGKKLLSNLSERELGAYVTASMLLTKNQPLALRQQEVEFRNKVIHKGYLPTTEEANEFGNSVMIILNKGLVVLRSLASDALEAVYKNLLPKVSEENEKIYSQQTVGQVNLLTAIDVMHPAVNNGSRNEDVKSQFGRVLKEREPTKLVLMSSEEMDRRFPSKPTNDTIKNKNSYYLNGVQLPVIEDSNRSNEGIAYSGKHGVYVYAPDGWILDNKRMGPSPATFYPASLNRDGALTSGNFIYLCFSHKNKDWPSLDHLLKIQEEMIKENYKLPHIKFLDTIQRKDCVVCLRNLEADELGTIVDYTLFLDFEEVIIYITLLTHRDNEQINLKKLEWIAEKMFKGNVEYKKE